MRPLTAPPFPPLIRFQSTHPLRDATLWKIPPNHELTISIHAPLTGCDYIFSATIHASNYFNPRTPYGMRRGHKTKMKTRSNISIHAPLTGCDNKILCHAFNFINFNPRTPYGMRQVRNGII